MIGCRAERWTTASRWTRRSWKPLWLSREDLALVFAGDRPQIRPARRQYRAFILNAWLADHLD